MSDLLIEHCIICPTCWQENVLLLDLSESDQTYIEDCEVCCSSISVTLHADQGELIELRSALP